MDALSHELEPSGPHQATLQRQDNTPPSHDELKEIFTRLGGYADGLLDSAELAVKLQDIFEKHEECHAELTPSEWLAVHTLFDTYLEPCSHDSDDYEVDCWHMDLLNLCCNSSDDPIGDLDTQTERQQSADLQRVIHSVCVNYMKLPDDGIDYNEPLVYPEGRMIYFDPEGRIIPFDSENNVIELDDESKRRLQLLTLPVGFEAMLTDPEAQPVFEEQPKYEKPDFESQVDSVKTKTLSEALSEGFFPVLRIMGLSFIAFILWMIPGSFFPPLLFLAPVVPPAIAVLLFGVFDIGKETRITPILGVVSIVCMVYLMGQPTMSSALGIGIMFKAFVALHFLTPAAAGIFWMIHKFRQQKNELDAARAQKVAQFETKWNEEKKQQDDSWKIRRAQEEKAWEHACQLRERVLNSVKALNDHLREGNSQAIALNKQIDIHNIEVQQSVDELLDKVQHYADQITQTIAGLPWYPPDIKYATPKALQTIRDYVINGRAESMKEALNLYEHELCEDQKLCYLSNINENLTDGIASITEVLTNIHDQSVYTNEQLADTRRVLGSIEANAAATAMNTLRSARTGEITARAAREQAEEAKRAADAAVITAQNAEAAAQNSARAADAQERQAAVMEREEQRRESLRRSW